jgi:hypothetical protein
MLFPCFPGDFTHLTASPPPPHPPPGAGSAVLDAAAARSGEAIPAVSAAGL